MKLKRSLPLLLVLLCTITRGQGFSRLYPGLGESSVTGLQNGDVLLLNNAPAAAVATRLDPDGAVVWSRDFAPLIPVIWGGVELANGDLLCLVHIEDDQMPGIFVNGIMRLDAGGDIVRVRAFPDLPVDPNAPRRSYLVPHTSDDEYHYIFLPSLNNNVRLHHMSDQDEVISAFDTGGDGYYPMMSLVERDGLLYGLSVFHVGKLHYDGSVIWRKYISGNARWMWQIISLGEGFAIRYQSSGDGAHRPGIALMDTTGTLSHDAVFDLVGSGYLNADLIAWDEGLALCATRFTDSSTTCHLILCDTLLGNISMHVADLAPNTLDDATVTPNNGLAMCGRNGTWTGDAWLAVSGPDHTLGPCWTSAPLDTLTTPPWPTWMDWPSFPEPAPDLSVLRTVPSVAYTPAEEVICSALGVTDTRATAPQVVIQHTTDAVLVRSAGAPIISCTVHDAMGRLVASRSGRYTQLMLSTPFASGIHVVRVALADGAVVSTKLVLE